MTSSLENSARMRQPRSRQAPSQRDQQLYLDYQTTGKRQIDLAAQYELTQCRISQIIRRVEKWLTSTLDLGPETLDSAPRESLERRLQYERLSEASRLAMQHFHEPQKIVTHKKGARAGKQFDETTERLLPANLQCLKIVAQTSAQLTRLQASGGRQAPDHSPLPTASPSPAATPNDATLSRENVEAWLVEHNRQAALANKVPYEFEAEYFIHDLVDTLTGESKNHVALHTLARQAGQKVVQRRPYEEKSPPVPNRDGWYYGMYDANGGLVAWLHADQLAGAITPDYPPVSRSAPSPAPAAETHNSPSDAPTPLLTLVVVLHPPPLILRNPQAHQHLPPPPLNLTFQRNMSQTPSTSNPFNQPFTSRAAPSDVTAHTLPQTGSFPRACICT